MTDSTPQGREKGAGERARELAMKAALEIGERLASCAPIWAGDVADIIERALATSAREARLEEARWWDEHMGETTADIHDRYQRLKWLEREAHAQAVQAIATQEQPSTVVENEPSGELD